MIGRATNKQPYPDSGKDLPVECPKCGKVIRKNRVDVRRFNWDGIELGLCGLLLAPFFPHETIEYQCEHCGKIFSIPPVEGKRGSRWLRAGVQLLNIAFVIFFVWLIFFYKRK